MLHTAKTAAIAFVDATLPDLETLLAGLAGKVETHLLNRDQDGLVQIADYLDGKEAIPALHLIAHGAPGQLFLGNSTVDREKLQKSRDEIEAIANALAEDGELLIYGCEVAAGREGRKFIDALTKMTGLKVAAATHKVGHQSLGGDWSLNIGLPTTSLRVTGWEHVLAVPADEDFTDNEINGPLPYEDDPTMVNVGLNFGGEEGAFSVGTNNVTSGFTRENNALLMSGSGASYVDFSSVDPDGQAPFIKPLFSLEQLSAGFLTTDTYCSSFTISGLAAGSTVVSGVSVDFTTSGEYGSGDFKIKYTKSVAPDGANAAGGTLIFGRGWTGIDTVRFTNAGSGDISLVLDNIIFSDPAATPTFTFNINTSTGEWPNESYSETKAGVTLTLDTGAYWGSNNDQGAWLTGDQASDGASTFSFSQAINITSIDWVYGTENDEVTFVGQTSGGPKTQTFSLDGSDRQTLTFTGWEGVTSFKITGETIAGDSIDNIVFAVADAADNTPPSISSTPVTSVDEGALYNYTLTATDPDVNDTLTWTVKDGMELPSWLKLGKGEAAATLADGFIDPGGMAYDEGTGNIYATTSSFISAMMGGDTVQSQICKIAPDGTKTVFTDHMPGQVGSMVVLNGYLYAGYIEGGGLSI